MEIGPVVLEKKRKSFNIVNYIYTILLLEKKNESALPMDDLLKSVEIC